MFRRFLIGFAFLAHGLAHARPGMFATAAGRTSIPGYFGVPEFITTWLAAVLLAATFAGFAAASFGAWGALPFRAHWRRIAVTAAILSLVLLGLFPGDPYAATGAVLDAVILLLFVRRREPARTPAEAEADPAPEAPRPRSRVRTFASGLAVLAVAYLAGAALLRPFYLRWGVTGDEVRSTLAGDDATIDAAFVSDHGVTVRAPVEQVWPWLVQMGQDRGGFYSYAWLENLLALDIHNADRIHPEWQTLAVGDSVLATPPGWLGFRRAFGWRVTSVVPNDHLALEYWGTFAVRPTPDGGSRLLVRTRTGRPPLLAAPLMLLGFEPLHFLMQRGMLLGIRSRAERATAIVAN